MSSSRPIGRREPVPLPGGAPTTEDEVLAALELAAGLNGTDSPARVVEVAVEAARALGTEGGRALPRLLRRSERLAAAVSAALDRITRAEELRDAADRDRLTGVASRTALERRVADALSAADGAVAVVLCDLDRFRRVNEALGHTAGDELLRVVAERLSAAVGGAGTVARLGADEFVVAFPGVADGPELDRRIDGLDASLRPPVHLRGQLLYPTACFGRAAGTGGDVDALLRTAESDVRRAKELRHNRPPAGEAYDLLQLDADLHVAVEQDALVAHFQPQYDLRTGRLDGFEVLARWPHPRLGPVPPDVFIGLAEDNGLIHAIGDRMLQEAHRFWSALPGTTARLHVNVSTKQLAVPGFARRLETEFEGDRAALQRLTVELTESAFVLDQAAIVAELHAVRALGVGVAVDDFGSGYTSLAQLQQLPATELKIDKLFVQRAGVVGRGILEAILVVARSLGLTVVAEGIERPEQLAMLRALGCDRGQGHLFAPALPADLAASLPPELEGLLAG